MNVNTIDNRPYLFVPIEIKVREFDAKLLFSLIAAENGFNVILGAQKDLRVHIHKFPAGVYIDKSVAFTKIKWFKYFKKFGNLIYAWDEEGLVIHKDNYLDRRFSEEAFELIDLFFAWGKNHAKLINDKHFNEKHKFIATGNPRFDMLRPEIREFYAPDVKKIQNKYGKIILINTNFSLYNHLVDVEMWKKNFLKMSPKMNSDFIDGWIDFQKNTFEAFIDMIPKLLKRYSDYSIILRPHPAENHRRWEKVDSHYKNIHVIHENNVIEWILSSKVVIHSNCTTGVESFLLDVPVVAYRPEISEKYDTQLPNMVCENVFNESQLLSLLDDILIKGNLENINCKNERSLVAKEYVEALDGELASERIVKIIKDKIKHFQTYELTKRDIIHRSILNLIPLFKRNASVIRERVNGFHRRQYGKSLHIIKIETNKQMIPSISLNEANLFIDRFSNLLDRFKNINIKETSKNCFFISSS